MTIRLFALTAVLAGSVPAAENCFGFLNSHPERKPLPPEEAKQIQAAHLGHLKKMADEGVLVGAGPMVDGGNWRGILIFECESPEQVRALAEQDPAVARKLLVVDVYRWTNTGDVGVEYRRRIKENPDYPGNMIRVPVALGRKGPNADTIAAGQLDQLRKEHYVRLTDLKQQGKMAVAGPFHEGGDLVGIFVFQPIPGGEARALIEDDPLVQAGGMKFEMFEWYVEETVLPSRP